MPDPRSRRQRADDAIADMSANRDGPHMAMYGFLAVAQAIMATAEPEPPAVRLGSFVPIDAWTEFSLRSLHGMRWAIYSSTLEKNLEEFDALADAIAYRDHLIKNYDRQGA
jgi:hypothetical protein